MASEDDLKRTPPQREPQTWTDHDLLTRIYERQRAENERLDAIDIKLAALDSKYVSQVEFWPVKVIVYGGAGLVLTAVIGALVAMVVINRDTVRAVRTDRGLTDSTILSSRSH